MAEQRRARAASRWRGVAWLAASLLLVVGVSLGLVRARRSMLRAMLRPGAARLPPRRTATNARGGSALGKVRVLLLDGLSRDHADRLPALRALCKAGVSLDIDVGFPTVSLPVQHALWSGLWQAQSGLLFVIGRVEPRALTIPLALAKRSASAVAVAEAHCEIVRSFGFSQVACPSRGEPPMSPLQLGQNALAAARSAAPLVFVHFLAIDAMGHRLGASSAAYAREARRGDALLAALAKVRQANETLLVLSDHGHLPGGGHGGPEPAIRRVRCCAVGPGLRSGGAGRGNIVDVNRLIGDQLGIAPLARSQGRALARLLAGAAAPAAPPVRPAMLHRFGALLAALALGVLLAVAWRRGQGPLAALLAFPWALLAALVIYALRRGAAPSLSHAEVYPLLHSALRPSLYLAGPLLLAQLWLLSRRLGYRLAAPLLVGTVAAAAAVLLGAAGWPLARSPVEALTTASASITCAVAAPLCALIAPALLLASAFSTSRSSTPHSSSTSASPRRRALSAAAAAEPGGPSDA